MYSYSFHCFVVFHYMNTYIIYLFSFCWWALGIFQFGEIMNYSAMGFHARPSWSPRAPGIEFFDYFTLIQRPAKQLKTISDVVP